MNFIKITKYLPFFNDKAARTFCAVETIILRAGTLDSKTAFSTTPTYCWTLQTVSDLCTRHVKHVK